MDGIDLKDGMILQGYYYREREFLYDVIVMNDDA